MAWSFQLGSNTRCTAGNKRAPLGTTLCSPCTRTTLSRAELFHTVNSASPAPSKRTFTWKSSAVAAWLTMTALLPRVISAKRVLWSCCVSPWLPRMSTGVSHAIRLGAGHLPRGPAPG